MADRLKMPTPKEFEAAKDNPAAMEELYKRADSVTAQAKQKRPLDPGFAGPAQPKPKPSPIKQGPNSKPVSDGKSFFHADNKAPKGN